MALLYLLVSQINCSRDLATGGHKEDKIQSRLICHTEKIVVLLSCLDLTMNFSSVNPT